MQTSLLPHHHHHQLVVGTHSSANRYLLDPTPHPSKEKAALTKKNHGRNGNNLGPNISETIKRRLSLGARIIQVGGVEKFFKQHFRVTDEERLLKGSQCYLSTTSGPLAGFLFISTEKVGFCSERSIKVFNQKGQMCRIRYKVTIPLTKIKCVNQSQNVEKPRQKYINIVTKDNFDFWLMGVSKYQKTFNYLQLAISQA